MLKICGSSIYKPLELILKQCIETGVFPSEWKKDNIVRIHKKGDKQTLKIIVQCLCYLFVEKFLKDYSLTKCLNSLLKKNLFYQISPALNRVILALISYYLSLMRYMNLLMWDLNYRMIFFSIWVFYHDHSRITGLQEKGEGITLTPHYHFHPLHRHLDISRAITTESSPSLHIDSSRTRTGNLWFPSASR